MTTARKRTTPVDPDIIEPEVVVQTEPTLDIEAAPDALLIPVSELPEWAQAFAECGFHRIYENCGCHNASAEPIRKQRSNIQSISCDGRGISREWNEQLEEHTGVIFKYAPTGDENNLAYEHTAESLAAALVKRLGLVFTDPNDEELVRYTDDVRRLLKSRATDTATVYPLVQREGAERRDGSRSKWTVPQGVPFDLGAHSLADSEGREWGLPVPYIHFCALLPTDSIYDEKTAKYAAIVFDPARMNVDRDPYDDDGEDRPLPRTVVWNGRPVTVASDWDWGCFTGVARTFATRSDMKRERTLLKRALNAIRVNATPSDEEDDPFANNSWLDENEKKQEHAKITTL